jgi:hypothetical protein
VYVQNPNERMGIGQSLVPPQRARQPARYRLRVRLREDTPWPPRSGLGRWGDRPIFPHFFHNFVN